MQKRTVRMSKNTTLKKRKRKMQLQTLESAKNLINTRVTATKKRGCLTLSVNSVFKEIRENEKFSFFGDYPILGLVVNEIQKGGFNVRRDSLLKTMNKTEDLKESTQTLKSTLADQLLTPTQSIQKMNTRRNKSLNRLFIKNPTRYSLKGGNDLLNAMF